jgi:hypothetical protein
MPLLKRIRRLLLWLLPTSLAGVGTLGIMLFRQALQADSGAVWLAGWVVAFVVGVPVSIVVLALAGAIRGHAGSRAIVPMAGEKIPGAGQ